MGEQEYDKEQLRIMRNAFKAFDHDEKGVIDHADVQSILEILGQKLEEKAIKALIKEVDKGNTGKLDFSQFCRLAARFIEVEEDANALASELKEAFRVYDKEGKGYITVAILRDILHELDDKISNSDLDLIIEEIDADGSGTVDFDEFMQVMTGKNFYDLSLHRRFVFESNCLPPQPPPNPHLYQNRKHGYCPSNRSRLHRRIEWHFERLFEQMFEPLHAPPRCCRNNVCSSYTSSSYDSTTSTASPSKPKLKPSPPTKPFKVIPRIVPSSPSTSSCKVATTTTTTTTCWHRPIFRPCFPKWVPIFTLYRDIVQNPFRRRRHYMITQH